MSRKKSGLKKTLAENLPPSEPCACQVSLGFCARPGWWTVEEAARAFKDCERSLRVT